MGNACFTSLSKRAIGLNFKLTYAVQLSDLFKQLEKDGVVNGEVLLMLLKLFKVSMTNYLNGHTLINNVDNIAQLITNDGHGLHKICLVLIRVIGIGKASVDCSYVN